MRYLLSLLLIAGFVNPAAAHELKTALTKVLFNQRTGNIEVMHRFYLHDAEHAVKILFSKDADILNSEQTQDTFSQYVSEHFALQQLNGDNINLTLLGGQLEGRFFWVYQETAIPKTINGLKAAQSALQDIWPAQLNTVNFEGKGRVKTLSFDNQSSWLQVNF
ncbi:DUF6702 family protein [Rheinheimera metallidurans]|uniref:DUF6702 family protein n=1 Tax=Rheinheimera metallidurans TaxID=2925781 RepID=UPI0030017D88